MIKQEGRPWPVFASDTHPQSNIFFSHLASGSRACLSPGALQLQCYAEVYVIPVWSSSRETASVVVWVLDKDNSGIIPHLTAAREFSFLFLFGLSSWLSVTEATEGALKGETHFATIFV